MKTCTNLNGYAMGRRGLHPRLSLEVKSMHARDVRNVEAVAEDDVGVAGNALHRKAQEMRTILGLRHGEVVRRCFAGPHPRHAPALANGIRRDAGAVRANSVGVPAPSVKGALQALVNHFAEREIGAEVTAGALDRPQLAREIAIDDHVALSDGNLPDLSATKRARPADGIPAFEDDFRIREAVHGVTSPNGDSSPRRNRTTNPARNRM